MIILGLKSKVQKFPVILRFENFECRHNGLNVQYTMVVRMKVEGVQFTFLIRGGFCRKKGIRHALYLYNLVLQPAPICERCLRHNYQKLYKWFARYFSKWLKPNPKMKKRIKQTRYYPIICIFKNQTFYYAGAGGKYGAVTSKYESEE